MYDEITLDISSYIYFMLLKCYCYTKYNNMYNKYFYTNVTTYLKKLYFLVLPVAAAPVLDIMFKSA